MMQDDRSNGQALAGLFDTDMLMSDEFSRRKKEQELLSMPTSLVDQMDERHGKFKSRMGLFAHALGGGTAEDYGDADLVSQYNADKQAYDMQQKIAGFGQIMPFVNEQIGYLQDDDPTNDAAAHFGLSQAGVDDKTRAAMFPGMAMAAGQKPPTYTEGDYQKIGGKWNLVQQANDGSVKYTEMGPDFTPTNRMMSPDSLQSGLQEYQTASFGAAQNEEDLDSIINTMDELGEENWGATGFAGEVGEKWKELTGTEDATTMARKTYDKIRTTRAIQNLPPGVASDKDIELVMKPFPKGTMNYQELRKYMEQLKRGEQKIREYNNFSSRYLSNKGKRDGMVEAWDSHWDEMTSEGGKFYEEKSQESGGQGSKYDGPTDFTGMSEFDADEAIGKLPSGTVFTGPDGKRYRSK